MNDKTDIDAFVRHATLLHDGTRVYRFSNELLAFLQTLVAFCPYYVANDPNTAGPMDSCYAEALRDYTAVTYEALHSYLIEGLRYWYELYPPSQEVWWADVDEADAQDTVEDAREARGAVMRVDPVQPPATFSMAFKPRALQRALRRPRALPGPKPRSTARAQAAPAPAGAGAAVEAAAAK